MYHRHRTATRHVHPAKAKPMTNLRDERNSRAATHPREMQHWCRHDGAVEPTPALLYGFEQDEPTHRMREREIGGGQSGNTTSRIKASRSADTHRRFDVSLRGSLSADRTALPTPFMRRPVNPPRAAPDHLEYFRSCLHARSSRRPCRAGVPSAPAGV